MATAPFLLPEWAQLADCGDDQWQLLPAVLRVAADEYPDLDATRCDQVLQGLADTLSAQVAAIDSLPLKMAAINHHLFHVVGFKGAGQDYYAADNNHLNRVLHTRQGNPLALSIIQIEVASRLGLPIHGVAFPGHFLTALYLGDDVTLVMDPYHGGRPLGLEQLERLAAHHLGGQVPEPELLARLLMPATARAIVLRLLLNLQRSWLSNQQWDKVARCADRQLCLAPEQHEARRDRGLAYLQLGHLAAAYRDLAAYVRFRPDADDVETLSQLMGELPLRSPKVH